MTILLMIVYYFSNRYYDKKDALKKQTEEVKQEDFKVDVPLIYAILPVLPLILLIVFSKIYPVIQFFGRTRHNNSHADVILRCHRF